MTWGKYGAVVDDAGRANSALEDLKGSFVPKSRFFNFIRLESVACEVN
jgi:hypothetical protein